MIFSKPVKGRSLDKDGGSIATVSFLMATVIILFGIFYSNTPALWAIAVLSLPVAISLSTVDFKFPIILLQIGLVWFPIFATILSWDLQPSGVTDDPNQWYAILLSLLAMLAIALGTV